MLTFQDEIISWLETNFNISPSLLICCDVEERFQMSPAIMEFLELKHWGQLFQNLDGFRDNLVQVNKTVFASDNNNKNRLLAVGMKF